MSAARSPAARLTPARLAAILALSFGGCAVLLVLLPLLGVDTTSGGPGSRSLDVLGLSALRGGGVDATIYLRDRLPRALAAAVVGGGLAAAGCAFQATLRNPLAEPYTLGISSGSSLAAVVAIRLGLDAWGDNAVGLFALVGALVTVWLVWRLARVSRSHPPATLLLAGITIAMFCSAASLVVQYTADYTEVYRIVRWMMGGLDWVDASSLLESGLAIGLGVAVLLTQSRNLNALAAGEEAAASVGVDPRRTMRLSMGAASLVVGAAIAIAGPIGFIGLIVPHALRPFTGPDHRALLPASIAAGAALLLVCDTVARTVIAPGQLPVGAVTAVLGGPYFLYLLAGEKSRARLWGG